MIHPSLIPTTLATLLMTGAAQAQSASFTGSGFTENFNSMGTAGTTRPTGWTTWNGASGSGNGTWTTSITANGATNSVASMVSITAALTASSAPTANNNNGYNAQSGTAADRAMATAPTSNSATASQLAIVNNSAVDLASIQIAYDIRRYTAPATVNELPGYWLFYSLDGTTWTNVAALNPTVSGTSGVIVPNSVGVTSVATTTVNLSSAWTVGSTLRFRWIDDNAVATSPDQVFGLDNVVISLAQAAPTVSLTAPANASTNVLPAAVNLVADAADSNGSVAKVEFFQGVTKLGEVVNPGPFQFSWSGMLSGSYVLTARATDNDGAATTSAPVSITVTNPNNLAPAVAISSPANDATVPAASLVIDANASDPDGLISKVEFYNGSTLLGQDTSAPFSHTISSVAVGTYALTAVATDNDGAVTTSAVVNVNTVTFTDSTTIPRGAAWKFLDDGSDQGTAWKETAFDDTAWIAGTAELGYADSPVTALAQSATTGGPKFITYYFRRHFSIADAAQVIGLRTNLERDDGAIIYLNGTEVARSNMNSGAVDYLTQSATIVSNADETTYFPITLPASSLVSGDNVIAVSIHQRDNTSSDLSFDLDLITTTAGGNALPVVQLTAPANGSTVNVGNPIAITATATDDDGSVQKVEFFQGTTKLGEDLVSPYEFTWSGAATGTHSLTAVATDDLGGTSTSAAITLTVATGPSGNLTRGPYLNMANQNSIVVRWRGSQSIIGRVRYGLAP
ncbi:Ig-like domain-containing protein, partial [bacterium]|nr:Ig-like domain-containing protein [bacterium]